MADRISSGAPRPEGFNRGAGFEYKDSRIDDETALEAGKNLGSSEGATRDAAALEIQFDRMMNGQIGNDYAVPGWVAQNGMDDVRQGEVLSLLDEMGDVANMDPAMIEQAKGMYRDGIQSQEFAKQQGLQPYGQRPHDLGTWNK